MPGAGDYQFYRSQYHDKSVTKDILAATDYSSGDGTAVVSVKNANYCIYVQRILISITTWAAKVWTFNDSAGTPVMVGSVSIPATQPTTGGDAQFVLDFGPKGKKLTLGKNLLMDMSGAGAAGSVVIEAYEKLDTTVAYDAGASLQ